MLRRNRVLPVVAALEPSVQHVGIERRRRDVAAERRRRRRRAKLVELDVAVRVERQAVAVDVVRPRTAVGDAQRRDGIDVVGDGNLLAGDVAGDARLHCRPAVAEDVEGHADARRDILPVLHVPDAARFRIVLAVGALSVMLAGVEPARQHVAFLRLADEPVVAQPGVDRGAAHRPLVLRVNPGVGLDAVAAVGRQPQRHGRRARRS